MLKKNTLSLLLTVVVIMSFAVPVFAATESPTDAPGLVSERIVTDEYGNKITIRLFNLDENGNMPVPESRALTTLYNGSTWLSTGGFTTIVSAHKVQSNLREAVNCYNYGPQAVTFNCDSSTVAQQAVGSGQACQFIIEWVGPKPMYSVGCKANWSDHQASLKVTAQ